MSHCLFSGNHRNVSKMEPEILLQERQRRGSMIKCNSLWSIVVALKKLWFPQVLLLHQSQNSVGNQVFHVAKNKTFHSKQYWYIRYVSYIIFYSKISLIYCGEQQLVGRSVQCHHPALFTVTTVIWMNTQLPQCVIDMH